MKRLLALLFVLAAIFSCVVYVTAVEDAAATAGAPSSFTLKDGASIRLVEGDSGLRFETRILTSELNALKAEGNVIVGTLIIPTDKLTGELTLDTPDAMNLVGNGTVDGDETVFYAAIVDILPQNYARKFSARSYVKVGDGEPMYTAYSDAKNARSVHEVAVEAWNGSYKNDSIVKGYLDKVVVIDAFMNQTSAAKGYVSPFLVSHGDSTLTITAKDGTLVYDDVATILLDGRAYTGGWTVAGNKLTAPYGFLFKLDFIDSKTTNLSNASAKLDLRLSGGGNANALRFVAESRTGSATTLVQDGQAGTLTMTIAENDKTNFPQILSQFTGKTVFANANAMSVSMSIKLPSGVTSLPTANIRLRNSSSSDVCVFAKLDGNQVKLPNGSVVATVTQDGYVTVTLTLDLKSNTVYGYCNGELVATQKGLSLPSGASSLLSWAKGATGFAFFECSMASSTDAKGFCLDDFAIRTFSVN